MSRHGKLKRRSMLSAIPMRVSRAITWRSAIVGTALAISRFFLLSSLLLLTAWSYSLWGSENSPLRHLLFPALILLLLSLLIRLVIIEVMEWTHRAVRVQNRRSDIQQKIRDTRAAKKLDQE
jgi:hypothetical protein